MVTRMARWLAVCQDPIVAVMHLLMFLSHIISDTFSRFIKLETAQIFTITKEQMLD